MLAEHYDELFTPHRGPYAEARRRLLRRWMPRVESACDLGCGTGETALELAAAGIRTYAVDESPWMCRATRAKARRADATIRVIESDMRRFALPEAVDLLTCECDALNHVARKSDLGKVLRCAARALRRGGHAFFDVNMRPGFESYWKGAFWVEAPRAVAVMRSGHRGERAWSDVEVFVKEGPLWRRHRERVEEVCWSAAEMERAFRLAGFDSVEAHDSAILGPGCRTFYVARKG